MFGPIAMPQKRNVQRFCPSVLFFDHVMKKAAPEGGFDTTTLR
jgi:hypothetical protein